MASCTWPTPTMAAAAAEDWPQLQHGPGHRGHTVDQPRPPLRIKWTRSLGEPTHTGCPPIVADQSWGLCLGGDELLTVRDPGWVASEGAYCHVNLKTGEGRYLTDERTVVKEALRGGMMVMPAYAGASLPIFDLTFGSTARRLQVDRDQWDHQVAGYEVDRKAMACGVLSRLSPAVSIDSPGNMMAIQPGSEGGAAPAFVAFVRNGRPIVRRVPGLKGAAFEPEEPWILAWFGHATPHRGYRGVIDLDDGYDAGMAKLTGSHLRAKI
jgi:hypothetical protein